jgi:hypothetical protein
MNESVDSANEWISAAKAVALLKGSLDDFQAAGAAEAAAVLAGGKFSGWQWVHKPRRRTTRQMISAICFFNAARRLATTGHRANSTPHAGQAGGSFGGARDPFQKYRRPQIGA